MKLATQFHSFKSWVNVCKATGNILIILLLSLIGLATAAQGIPDFNNRATISGFEATGNGSESERILLFLKTMLDRSGSGPNQSKGIQIQVRNSIEPRKFKMPPPEVHMDCPQLIRHYGYPVEEHLVLTEDGYILKLFRIPGKYTGVGNIISGKEPVLFAHSLLSSSDDWVFHFHNPGDNLPIMLYEQGHDIWLGNVRGNDYSLHHVTLTQNDLEFWNFGVDEMGLYDTPAMINYILKVTRQSQLSYIGHSMGTSMFFIAMSAYPDLQSKVKKMIAFAPAVYISHSTAAIRLLTIIPDIFFQVAKAKVAGGRAFPTHLTESIHRKGPKICLGRLNGYPCALLINFVAGLDTSLKDDDTSSMIMGHAPSTGSCNTVLHFKQWMLKGKFQAFDFGKSKNVLKYNSISPPMYCLKNVQVPVYVFTAPADIFVRPKDVKRFISELPNVQFCEKVPYAKFSHLDFVYSKYARVLVYDRVRQFF